MADMAKYQFPVPTKTYTSNKAFSINQLMIKKPKKQIDHQIFHLFIFSFFHKVEMVPQMLQSQHILTNHFLSSTLSPSLNVIHRPLTPFSVPTHVRARPESWLAQASESTTTTKANIAPTTVREEGPIELPPNYSPIFATSDDPSSLQVTTSVLLTGSITIFLFRSLRRRAKRVKEMKFRSDGVKKSLKEEALDSLKAMGSSTIEAKSTPSPVQAFLGAIAAGVIALILYKFTTTIEAALNRQTISDNFSVQQITITIRTIVNGLCYLATFVFGINSVGLFLYAGQLTIDSLVEGSNDKENDSDREGEEQSGFLNSTTESPTNSIDGSKGDQNSDLRQ